MDLFVVGWELLGAFDSIFGKGQLSDAFDDSITDSTARGAVDLPTKLLIKEALASVVGVECESVSVGR